MTLEQLSYLAAIAGASASLIGFPVVVWQLFVSRSQQRDAIRLSTSQVLFAADAVIATHADVAAKLRGGEWAGEKGKLHPSGESELALVEPYMGVFERIFIAYRAGQIDEDTLEQLYSYRLSNIWANERIVNGKLQNDSLKIYWKRFIALTYVLESHKGKRFELHTDTYFPEELFDRRSAKRILKNVPQHGQL
jgi:hypothetical protein